MGSIHLLLTGLLVTALAGEAPAGYPISPRPLRRLCQEAEVVVVAEVGAPAEGATAGLDLGEARGSTSPGDARWSRHGLHVLEHLKGDPGAPVVNVATYPMICPAPPVYPDGATVIAFLRRREEAGWTTHALSYGAKPVSEAALDVYRQRISECLEILALEDELERRARTVEWLVRCCEHLTTRWEGAYELNRAGDFMSDYDDSPDPLFGRDLSAGQRQRLVEALLGATTIRRGEEILIDLLKRHEDPRLTPFLIERLRAASVDGPIDLWLLMRVIAQRRNDRRLEELAHRFDSPGVTSLTERTQTGKDPRADVLREFLERL